MALVRLIALSVLVFMPVQVSADTFVDIVAKVKPGIVGIGSHDPLARPPNDLNGTGLVVAGGNHVITAFHVVEGVRKLARGQLAVFIGQGERAAVRHANMVAHDETYDMALLKIDGRPLPPLDLHEGDLLADGTGIAFTGFPVGAVYGLYPATHRGIVAATTPIARPQVTIGELTPEMIRRLQERIVVYQLDATAFPGNSGGPVYSAETGEVVAILNSTYVKESKESVFTRPSGVSFAIPISHALRLMRRVGLE